MPIIVAKKSILFSLEMFLNFVDFQYPIDRKNNKSDKRHYVKNNFHITPCF